MLGVLAVLSFVFPLIGSLAVRRFSWVGICLGAVALMTAGTYYVITTSNSDTIAPGDLTILLSIPAIIGSGLGCLINVFIRIAKGAGELKPINLTVATLWGLTMGGFGLVLISSL